jgi:hypothetical protein
MQSVPRRVQLAVVAAGYMAALLVAGMRHLGHVNHPTAGELPGGLYAFNPLVNWMWGLLTGSLFLIPTFLLVLVIRKSETAYTRYSQILLGLSFTAPIGWVVLIPALGPEIGFLFALCLYRLWGSPIVIVGLAVSWWFARFGRAKRLILYALLVEVGTFVLFIAFFVWAFSVPRW